MDGILFLIYLVFMFSKFVWIIADNIIEEWDK